MQSSRAVRASARSPRRRRRTVTWVVPALAAVVLTGCADGDVERDGSASSSATSSRAPGDGSSTVDGDAAGGTGARTSSAVALRPDGLGVVEFGAEEDDAVEALSDELGPPSDDTGWRPSGELGADCPGTEGRILTWGDGLAVLFSDDGGSGRYLAGFRYEVSPTMTPSGLVTPAGITLGSSRRDVEAADPSAEVERDGGAVTAWLSDGIVAVLSGPGAEGSVVALSAGLPCGG